MKLGEVLAKERKKMELSVAVVAERLGIPEDEYREIEAGDSPAEVWFPHLCGIAVALGVATSRLLADSGRFADTRAGQAGPLIKGHRERLEKTAEEVVEFVERERVEPTPSLSIEEYLEIEAGTSPVEKYGPLMLAFAEAIDQPVFNLYYPCGLPFQELDDYP